MINEALQQLKGIFKLEKIDIDNYTKFKAGVLSVDLECYDAKELGHISVLKGKALGGVMKIETLIITPTMRDMPLFSFDWVSAMGKNTVLIEFYNTMIGDKGFDEQSLENALNSLILLNEYDVGTHWYDNIRLAASIAKKVKRKELPLVQHCLEDEITAWSKMAIESEVLTKDQQYRKHERTSDYVNGLLENGGPSTDAFSKAIGKTATKELFTQYIF